MVVPAMPVLELKRHAAPSDWTPAQRGRLDAQLRKLGTTITELSDARELCGFERLSEASPEDRLEAHHNLESPDIQAAIARVRVERLEWLAMLSSCDEEAVREARSVLGLRANRLLRLGELQALYAQTAIVELTWGLR